MTPARQRAGLVALLLSCMIACAEPSEPGPAQPLASIEWTQPPSSSAAVDQALQGAWAVETDGEVHICELRACMGMVEDCGLEGDDDASAIASMTPDGYEAELPLPAAGEWTVVAWCHVDTEPYISTPVSVTVG